MDSAIVRKAARSGECTRESETGVMDAGIKYPVGIAGRSGSYTVIIANPVPLNRIACSNSNRAGTVNGPAALTHRNNLCRRKSDVWKEKSEY